MENNYGNLCSIKLYKLLVCALFEKMKKNVASETGPGRKRMWFNDCVVITFHSTVKPELMAYKKCGSVTTCSMEFQPKLSHSFLMSLF